MHSQNGDLTETRARFSMITELHAQHSTDRYRESARIFERNRKYIPGGVISVNRATQREISFVRGYGA